MSLQILNRFKSVGSAKVALVNFILCQDESKDLIFEFDIQEQALISDLVLEKAVDLVIELVEDLSELSHELLFPVLGPLLLEDVRMVELLQEGLHRSDHLKILVVGEVHMGLCGLWGTKLLVADHAQRARGEVGVVGGPFVFRVFCIPSSKSLSFSH